MTKLPTYGKGRLNKGEPGEVLFEMARVGSLMRVTAVDTETGTEVVIQGPASLTSVELQRVALAKLRYVLKKQQTQKE